MTFKEWLESKREEIEEAEDLIKKMAQEKISWPSEIKKKEELTKVIIKSEANDTVKTNLTAHVDNLWAEYEKKTAVAIQKKPSGSGPIKLLPDALATHAQFLGLAGIAILLLVLIFVALFGKNEFLHNLSNVEFARGLITFLFALGTIGIALIITFSVFTSERPLDESKERFYRGKEILTILIGILGTIVGFYFGSPTDSVEYGV